MMDDDRVEENGVINFMLRKENFFGIDYLFNFVMQSEMYEIVRFNL